eukprot:10554823-Alexandrium_andersonii.AAC.1
MPGLRAKVHLGHPGRRACREHGGRRRSRPKSDWAIGVRSHDCHRRRQGQARPPAPPAARVPQVPVN